MKQYNHKRKRKMVMSLLILHLFAFSLLVSSCDEQQFPDIDDILSSNEQVEKTGDALQIKDIKFCLIVHSCTTIIADNLLVTI